MAAPSGEEATTIAPQPVAEDVDPDFPYTVFTCKQTTIYDEANPALPKSVLWLPHKQHKHQGHIFFRQVLTVDLPDGSSKKVMCVTTTTARELLNGMADKLELNQREYFGILEFDSTGYENWLRPDEAVMRQVKDKDPRLLLTLKLYPAVLSDITDARALQLMAQQVHKDIVEDLYGLDLTKELAAQLCAYMVQAIFGNHNPSIHKAGYLKNPVGVASFLPARLLKKYRNKVWQEKIFALHPALTGLSAPQAHRAFLDESSRLQGFGVDSFDVRDGSGACALRLQIHPQHLRVVKRNDGNTGQAPAPDSPAALIPAVMQYLYLDIYRVMLERRGTRVIRHYRIVCFTSLEGIPEISFMTTNITDAELIVSLVEGYCQLHRKVLKARLGSSAVKSDNAPPSPSPAPTPSSPALDSVDEPVDLDKLRKKMQARMMVKRDSLTMLAIRPPPAPTAPTDWNTVKREVHLTLVDGSHPWTVEVEGTMLGSMVMGRYGSHMGIDVMTAMGLHVCERSATGDRPLDLLSPLLPQMSAADVRLVVGFQVWSADVPALAEPDCRPQLTRLSYLFCAFNVVKGYYQVGQEEAIQLAAYDLQIRLGVYEAERTVAYLTTENLRSLLPPAFCQESHIAALTEAYRALGSMDETTAARMHVELVARSVRDFGTSYVPGLTELDGQQFELMSISREFLTYYPSVSDRSRAAQVAFSSIAGWTNTDAKLEIQLQDENMVVTTCANSAEALAAGCVIDYFAES